MRKIRTGSTEACRRAPFVGVAQVGQGDDRTGTSRASLGNDPDDKEDPEQDPKGTTGTGHSDPGDNPTSGDNQGPQPVPWAGGGSSGTSGGSEQKK